MNAERAGQTSPAFLIFGTQQSDFQQSAGLEFLCHIKLVVQHQLFL
jgi:hypothetical protein